VDEGGGALDGAAPDRAGLAPAAQLLAERVGEHRRAGDDERPGIAARRELSDDAEDGPRPEPARH
jgi:hypothetical protein